MRIFGCTQSTSTLVLTWCRPIQAPKDPRPKSARPFQLSTSSWAFWAAQIARPSCDHCNMEYLMQTFPERRFDVTNWIEAWLGLPCCLITRCLL